MEEVELRKLQMTGGASYTLSLPKDWIKQQSLKVGDVIAVVTRADSSLSIVPHQKVPLGLDKTVETTLALSKDQDSEQALRVVVAHYLAGYDVIRIRFPPSSTPNLRTYLREAARRMFVGAEILEESRDELVIQCISSYDDLPAPKVIARMSLIAKLMVRDAVDSLRSRDVALSDEIIKRDEEVDRFYLFIIRQLTMAVLSRGMIQAIGLMDPRDCLVYRIVSKSLERIADHGTTIAAMSKTIEHPLPPRLLDEITKVSTLTNSVLEDALKALVKEDPVIANASIISAKRLVNDAERIASKFHEYHLGPSSVVAVRLVLESLKRVAEYSEDIAEMGINLTARRRELY